MSNRPILIATSEAEARLTANPEGMSDDVAFGQILPERFENRTKKFRPPAVKSTQAAKQRRQQFLINVRKFADDFKPYDTGIVSTPQADSGIGPVKYNISLEEQKATNPKKLRRLNELIKWEKRSGDAWIKFVAVLLTLATGQEDPDHHLPALIRMVTRARLQK
jgi:hypothetical protein